MAETMELAEPAPLCIENIKGQAQMGWTPLGLCEKHTLKHDWEVWNNVGDAVPMDGLTCPEIRLSVILEGRLICLPELRKLPQSGNLSILEKYLRHDAGQSLPHDGTNH